MGLEVTNYLNRVTPRREEDVIAWSRLYSRTGRFEEAFHILEGQMAQHHRCHECISILLKHLDGDVRLSLRLAKV